MHRLTPLFDSVEYITFIEPINSSLSYLNNHINKHYKHKLIHSNNHNNKNNNDSDEKGNEITDGVRASETIIKVKGKGHNINIMPSPSTPHQDQRPSQNITGALVITDRLDYHLEGEPRDRQEDNNSDDSDSTSNDILREREREKERDYFQNLHNHTLLLLPINQFIPNSIPIQYVYSIGRKLILIPCKLKVGLPERNSSEGLFYFGQYFVESYMSSYLLPLFKFWAGKDQIDPEPLKQPRKLFFRNNTNNNINSNNNSNNSNRNKKIPQFLSLFDYFKRDRTVSIGNNTTNVSNDKNECSVRSPVNGILVELINAASEQIPSGKKINKRKIKTLVKGESIDVTKLARTAPFIFNIYLRPSDYHHFHSPVNGRIINIIGMKGGRHFLFNNQSPEELPQLWTAIHYNTKILIHFKLDKKIKEEKDDDDQGEDVFMLIIGGRFINCIHIHENILLDYHESLKTGEAFNISFGVDLGYFSFGSSIVLLSSLPFNSKFAMDSIQDQEPLFCEQIKIGDPLCN